MAEEAPGDNTKTLCLLLAPCTASNPPKKWAEDPLGSSRPLFLKTVMRAAALPSHRRGCVPNAFSPCSQPRLWLPLLTLLSAPKAFISSRS